MAEQIDMQSRLEKPVDTQSNLALGEIVELMETSKLVTTDKIGKLIQQIIHDIKIGNEHTRSKAKIRSKRKPRKKTRPGVLERTMRKF